LRRIENFERLDSVQKYMLLQNARDLVVHLNDAYDDFPYDVYFSATEAIQKAMMYVDDILIHHENEI